MIRILKESDIPELMKFFYQDRNIDQGEDFNYTAEDLEEMLSYSHIIQYVFEENNKVIAYLCGYDMGVWGLLDVLIVKKEHRNKFIGTKLLQQIIIDNPNWKMLETSYYPEDKNSEKYLDKLKIDSKEKLIWAGKLL